ncbi:hypothetical protein Taro_050866 [Colocasia esculenta]|uniref:Uncharacterized protein n=1 Tax=Colocasia esculenta TaxID=4460 RepID=A0A843XEY0_COLES|nr:hypothetical protein [Colocasia esculenta]
MTPTVVTSPVGCPRFFVSQAVSSGLCPGTCVVPSRSVSSDLDTLTPGHVEELLVAEELWNDHKKPFFFPSSSAATYTNHSLEVDQS